MNTPPLAIRHLSRSLRAIVLVAVLALGSAAHLWHHVQDPHCGESRGPASHAERFCGACSNLHGATLAAGDAPAPAPAIVAWADFAAPRDAHHAAAPLTAGIPRAPPAA